MKTPEAMETLKALYAAGLDCRAKWSDNDKEACLSILERDILPLIDILTIQEQYGVTPTLLTRCDKMHPILGALDSDGNLCIWYNFLACGACYYLVCSIGATVHKMGKTLKAPDGQDWWEFVEKAKLRETHLVIPEEWE